MKNLIKLISLCLCIVSVLCSCNTSSDATDTYVINNTSPPDDRFIYKFNNYEEIKLAFTSGTEQNALLKKEQEKYGETYQKYLSYYTDKDFLLIPKHNGEVIPLIDDEGYSKVCLHTSDSYGQPWIWNYIKAGDETVFINMLYTDFMNDDHITEDLTGLQIVKMIGPRMPTPQNYKGSSWSNVCEKKIKLADRTVTALVYTDAEYGRNVVHFMYGKTYIKITGMPSALTKQFFEKLSFEVL